MSRTVLVPVDGSNSSITAFEYALETFETKSITLFHAIDPFDEASETAEHAPMTDEWLDAREAAAERLFTNVIERADRSAAETTTTETAVAVGEPAQAILAYAEDEDVDQLVLGSHGRGGRRDLRLGRVSELVVRRASVPVTVVR